MERILLAEMLENLEQDLADIDVNLWYKKNAIQSNQVVMQYLEKNLPWHDSLETHFGGLIQGTVFVNNLSTFESLKSIGIDLIRNDSLRQQITYVYSARYKLIDAKDAESTQANFDFLYPSLRQHLEFLPQGKARPVNPELIHESYTLRSDLNNYQHLVGLGIRAYETTRKSVVSLMDQIQRELDR